ncbi:hypothetical protein BIV57_12115 [Mangrovactinospora gilvigrisea]|uniref:Uncharacterized protein n=1 Tax=Mangrovactinospora gilvigrisea TaxID=1428644 RepID=A0A1J7CC55_9ACTN|nr:hypothetical protein [Mangrovactinospora gilvigrisea]OIV37250.1 hypothetical protein BIV57_12115 [Mangrovactinospora gilvigrisea]
MYAWIWRHLPGNTAVRAVIAVLLVVLVVYLLFQYAFPWLEPHVPFGGGGDGGGGTVGHGNGS